MAHCERAENPQNPKTAHTYIYGERRVCRHRHRIVIVVDVVVDVCFPYVVSTMQARCMSSPVVDKPPHIAHRILLLKLDAADAAAATAAAVVADAVATFANALNK